MTPNGLPDISDLERWTFAATALGKDPVAALTQRGVAVTGHGDGWITAGDVHLSLSAGCWYGTVIDPRMTVGSAEIGVRR